MFACLQLQPLQLHPLLLLHLVRGQRSVGISCLTDLSHCISRSRVPVDRDPGEEGQGAVSLPPSQRHRCHLPASLEHEGLVLLDGLLVDALVDGLVDGLVDALVDGLLVGNPTKLNCSPNGGGHLHDVFFQLAGAWQQDFCFRWVKRDLRSPPALPIADKRLKSLRPL